MRGLVSTSLLLAALVFSSGCLGAQHPYGHAPLAAEVAPLGSFVHVPRSEALLVLGAWDDAALQPMGVDYAADGSVQHTHSLFGVAPALREALHDALRASGVRVRIDSLDQGLVRPYPRLRSQRPVKLLRARLEALTFSRRPGEALQVVVRVAFWLGALPDPRVRWSKPVELELTGSDELLLDPDPILGVGAQLGAALLHDPEFLAALQ